MKVSLAISYAVLVVGCGSQRPESTVDGAPGDGSTSVVESSRIGQLAADDHDLFYVEDTAVKAIPLAGGTPTTLYTAVAPTGALTMIDRFVVGSSELLFVVSHIDDVTLATDETLFLVPKTGGTALALATSNDSRAFLGAAFDGNDVYFSTFDSMFRIPRTGGTTTFVGQSNGSTHYWVFTPVLTADQVYWAEGTNLYRMARTDSSKRGGLFATLPESESGKILAKGAKFVVALSPDLDFLAWPDAFVEIDSTTGAVGTRVPLAVANILEVAVTNSYVWTASPTGLVRVPRAGGEPVQALAAACTSVVAAGSSMYAATNAGIMRIPQP